jgi:hypothetical protein
VAKLKALAVALVAMVVLGGACSAGGSGEGDDARAATTEQATTTSSTVVPTTAPPTTSAAEAVAAGLCPALPDAAEPDRDRPSYVGEVMVDPATGTVTGEVTVRFSPDLDTVRLVFRLWANAPSPAAAGVTMEPGAVRDVDSGEVLPSERRDETTFVVPLAEPLEAGDTIEVELPFEMVVPGEVNDRVSRNGDSMRLGSFLPLLSWVPGGGWAEDPGTALFAEAVTSPTADYDIAVEVPDGYDVLATGVPTEDGRWQAEAVRDFAASVGHFAIATAVVDAPEPVTVTVGVQEGLADDPQAYLDVVAGSMVEYSERFGPYPWTSLTLAITPALTGGIEFPTHIMQGPDTLDEATAHEVGHMWFYSLVGNNQAVDPWLDEGLASYAEGTYEEVMPLFDAIVAGVAPGLLDEPMAYWATRPGEYFGNVYAQGAVAIARLGAVEMVDCALRHYVAAQQFGIAAPDDLLASLSVVFPGAGEHLASYGVDP